MGEPLIGSVICGAMALGMMWWNWQMMESQKRRGRKIAVEAARVARVRAQARADEAEKVAASAIAAAEAAEKVAAFEHSRVFSSSCLTKLEPLLECPSNSPIVNDPSPLFFKAVRDRLETAPMSPSLSASSPRVSEADFSTDESEIIEVAGWMRPTRTFADQRSPVMVADPDLALL